MLVQTSLHSHPHYDHPNLCLPLVTYSICASYIALWITEQRGLKVNLSQMKWDISNLTDHSIPVAIYHIHDAIFFFFACCGDQGRVGSMKLSYQGSWDLYTMHVEIAPDVRGPQVPFVSPMQLVGDGRWRQFLRTHLYEEVYNPPFTLALQWTGNFLTQKSITMKKKIFLHGTTWYFLTILSFKDGHWTYYIDT